MRGRGDFSINSYVQRIFSKDLMFVWVLETQMKEERSSLLVAAQIDDAINTSERNTIRTTSPNL